MKIVIIDIDTLRPDRLGAYGCDRGTSPHIDRLANDGVRFTRTYTSNSPCVPARAAMISGRHGLNNGLITHPGLGAWLSEKAFGKSSMGLMTRPLQKKKIKCASVSSFYKHDHGMETGWFAYAFDERFDPNPFRKCQMDSAADVNAMALPWIERNKNEDFLIHIHYWEPHTPYDLPKEKHAKFLKNKPWDYPTQEMKQNHVDQFYAQGAARFGIETVKGLDDFMNTYDAQIFEADVHVGQVVKTLEQNNILEDTLIIVTSDHGEQFGEQGMYGEHAAAVEPDLLVPLIIRFPKKANAGLVINELVYSQDMIPTIWEYAKTEKNETDFKSLLPLIDGKTSSLYPYLVCDHGLYTSTRAIIQKEWKLMLTYTPGYFGYQLYPPLCLYHLPTDPHETKNLAKENPQKVKELLGCLNEWRTKAGFEESNDPMVALGNKGPRTYDFPGFFVSEQIKKFNAK